MSAAMGIADRLLALESAVAALQEVVQGSPSPAPPPAAATDTERLAQQLGNSRLAGVLARAGYATPEAVAAASDQELLAIDGVAEKAIKLIREKVTV